MSLPNPDEYIRRITEEAYNEGKQDGIKETLVKMLQYYEDEISEKPCLQFMMGWEDRGCPCDCKKCIEEHLNDTESSNER